MLGLEKMRDLHESIVAAWEYSRIERELNAKFPELFDSRVLMAMTIADREKSPICEDEARNRVVTSVMQFMRATGSSIGEAAWQSKLSELKFNRDGTVADVNAYDTPV